MRFAISFARMRLVLTFFFAFALIAYADEAATGRWEGSVQIPGRELKLIVDLSKNSDGGWIGSIIVPGLAIKGVALTDIAVKNSETSFVMKSGGAQGLEASFKARLNADGTLAGDFVQAGNRAPLRLTKIGPPQVEVPPKSTAVAKELEGEWKGEYELLGYPRKVTVKLKNRGADGATAEFVVVGRKTNNLPINLITQEGEMLTIDSHETGISYEGHFLKGEIDGTLLQGPLEIPLVLRRAK
jgi:hypothetical protein